MSVDNFITKSILTGFMDWFTKISVIRYSDAITSLDNHVYISRKVIPVPVQWATYDKWFAIYNSSSARKSMDPTFRAKNPVEMQWILPRISVYMNGVMYDNTRKLIKTQKVPNFPNDSNTQRTRQYTPAPFNFDVDVAVITKTLDDSFQIMEQIIPFFSPDLSINVKTVPGMESESIPIVLNGVIPDIPTDISEEEERFFTFTYGFTIKANLYPKKKYSNTKQILINGISGTNEVIIDGNAEILGVTPGTLISGTNIPPETIVLSVNDPSTLVLSQIITNDIIDGIANISGGNIISSIDINECNFDAISNIITVPVSASDKLIPGMYVFGPGIGLNTYIESINNNTITITSHTVSAGVNVKLYFGSNSTINHVTSNLYMGKDYIQIDQEWIEYLQKIDEKFNEYEANANTPNPFL
ncbi:hypothetical protein GW796_05545 [archaeon]|nr:hypothetical protein [archaeon]NCQ51348.1 hypothetical protein [archaeon]NCT58826.1 hypothetical protein [archaeon]